MIFKHVGEFDDVLDSESSKSLENPSKGIHLTYDNVEESTLADNGTVPLDDVEKLLDIENLTVETPTKSILVKDLSLQINAKDRSKWEAFLVDLCVLGYYKFSRPFAYSKCGQDVLLIMKSWCGITMEAKQLKLQVLMEFQKSIQQILEETCLSTDTILLLLLHFLRLIIIIIIIEIGELS